MAEAGATIRQVIPGRLCLVSFGPAQEPNTAIGEEPCRLWLAPDRTLAVCEAADCVVPGDFVTDVTDGYAVLALSGQAVPDLLASGCTLDPTTLVTGRCAQTLFGGVRVLLHPRADALLIYVERSLAAFLLAWLRAAESALVA